MMTLMIDNEIMKQMVSWLVLMYMHPIVHLTLPSKYAFLSST